MSFIEFTGFWYMVNVAGQKRKKNKPGGDRVHICVMGWKWGLAPVGFLENMPLLAKKS
jgi:hypothetical protein